MASLYRVWHRPICLLTAIDGKARLLRFDGTEHSDHPA